MNEFDEYDVEEFLIQFGDWLERYPDENDTDFAERLVDAVGDIRGTVIRADGAYIVSK